MYRLKEGPRLNHNPHQHQPNDPFPLSLVGPMSRGTRRDLTNDHNQHILTTLKRFKNVHLTNTFQTHSLLNLLS